MHTALTIGNEEFRLQRKLLMIPTDALGQKEGLGLDGTSESPESFTKLTGLDPVL